jgi:hypothetical protein
VSHQKRNKQEKETYIHLRDREIDHGALGSCELVAEANESGLSQIYCRQLASRPGSRCPEWGLARNFAKATRVDASDFEKLKQQGMMSCKLSVTRRKGRTRPQSAVRCVYGPEETF